LRVLEHNAARKAKGVARIENSKDTASGRQLHIQYNFVKPYVVLDGQTPAQAAGLKVRGVERIVDAGCQGRCVKNFMRITLVAPAAIATMLKGKRIQTPKHTVHER